MLAGSEVPEPGRSIRGHKTFWFWGITEAMGLDGLKLQYELEEEIWGRFRLALSGKPD